MITLKKAELADFEDYFTIKCEKSDIYWNGFEQAPNADNLFIAYCGRLEDRPDSPGSKVLYFIVLPTGEKIGYIQLTYEKNETEFAYSILEAHQGRGYGTQAVMLIVQKIASGCLFARVREDNIASMRCFEKNRFIKDPNYAQLQYFPQDGKELIYYRFERCL